MVFVELIKMDLCPASYRLSCWSVALDSRRPLRRHVAFDRGVLQSHVSGPLLASPWSNSIVSRCFRANLLDLCRIQLLGRANIIADERSENRAAKATTPRLGIPGQDERDSGMIPNGIPG